MMFVWNRNPSAELPKKGTKAWSSWRPIKSEAPYLQRPSRHHSFRRARSWCYMFSKYVPNREENEWRNEWIYFMSRFCTFWFFLSVSCQFDLISYSDGVENLSLNPEKKNQLRSTQNFSTSLSKWRQQKSLRALIGDPIFLGGFTLDIQFLQFPLAAWNQAFRRKKWEEWALHAAWEASSKRHSWHLEETRHTSPWVSLCQEESDMNFFVLSSWILNRKVLQIHCLGGFHCKENQKWLQVFAGSP